MPIWLIIVTLGIAAWFAVSVVVGLLVGHLIGACSAMDPEHWGSVAPFGATRRRDRGRRRAARPRPASPRSWSRPRTRARAGRP
jgi:hypothetical protein